MKKVKEIRVLCNFKEGKLIKDEQETDLIDQVKKSILNTIQKFNINKKEVSLTVVISTRYYSEILYEEKTYRVIRTKHCKALVQKRYKQSNKKGLGYVWKDIAYFGTGTEQECLEKAMKEIERLKEKRKKRKSKKEAYIENIPKKDMKILKKSAGIE